MNFWKKLFKSDSPKEPGSLNENLIQKEDMIDYYKYARTNNEIQPVEKIIAELIYQRELSEDSINAFLHFGTDSDFGNSAWKNKGELNFPGPFYTGESDTCGTGIIEAPHNVIFDEHCREYVMIQPRNKKELSELWNAGAVEVFGSYYCDGNKHWTISLVKNWWSNKEDLLQHLKNTDLVKLNYNQDKRYEYYLKNEAEMDLRRYCFFLEHGFYPTGEKLPEIR